MKFPLSQHALKWIGPPKIGIEIGGASHNTWGVIAKNVAPNDQIDTAFFNQAQRDMGEEPLPIDIVAEGDELPLPDSSVDFVLSSHSLEHMPNVIKALVEWHRVCKDNGIIYVVLPHRDALPEDVPYPLTENEHHWEDYAANHTVDTHPTDTGPGGRRGHYHRFTLKSFCRLAEEINSIDNKKLLQVIDYEAVCSKVPNGFTVVLGVLK